MLFINYYSRFCETRNAHREHPVIQNDEIECNGRKFIDSNDIYLKESRLLVGWIKF